MNTVDSFKQFVPRVIILFFVLLTASQVNTNAQTIIYKKNGSQIQVSKLDTLSKTFRYKLYLQNDSATHYISQSAIDSIRFENGTRVFNTQPIMLPDTNEQEEKIRRNFIGFDIWPFFRGEVNAFYEILFLEDKLGFKNKISYESNNYYGYHGDEKREHYSFTSGLNFYFLHSEYFRFGTGMALEYGNRDIEDWETYYQNDNYYNQEEYIPPPIIKQPYSFLYTSISFSYIFKKTLYSTLEFNLPISLKQIKYHVEDPTIVRTEFSINF